MFTTVPLKSVAALQTPVTEVMRRGVITLPSSATLADAASAMRAHGVHAVLIEAADGERLGWVTSRGVLHNHARDWSAAATAVEAITDKAVSVRQSATLADAINAFIATGASHILVAETGDKPLGVIAESDLVGFMAR